MCSIRRKATLQSILLSYEKFVREKEITFRYQKKDKYWLIKSWLHRRRSAHFYIVVHINNNHQDTLQLTLIRLTPKVCLRRVSQSVASHQVLTSLRYILLDLDLLSSLFFFFFFFSFFFSFFFFLEGGGGDMISPPHKHDVLKNKKASKRV